MTQFAESVVEDAALAWLETLGYAVLHGPVIAAGELTAERSDPNYRDVVLERRLRQALVRLNPDLPPEALQDAYRKIARTDAASLLERNRAVHRMLVDGVTVEYRRKDGSIAGAQAQLLDFNAADNNDWLAVNQFTVAEGHHTRRPDVLLFVNGLPLAAIELKNPADENATIWSAFQQLETYQAQIPTLFATNAALVVSDGVQARIGTLGAGKEWFKPWRTISGRDDAPPNLAELQVVLEGVFEKRRFLDLVRHFIVFEDLGGGKLAKKMAGYHQFHAVECGRGGDVAGRAGTPGCRDSRSLRSGPQTGRRAGGPPRRRGVAHARLRQELDHGLLCRVESSFIQRWRTPPSSCSPIATTSTTSSSGRLPAAAIYCASRPCRRPTAPTCARNSPSRRRCDLHNDPEVLS